MEYKENRQMFKEIEISGSLASETATWMHAV
jgi:hypothetical protein